MFVSKMRELAQPSLKRRLYVIIFEHDTPGGRAFDVALLAAVLLSVLAVALESVGEARARAGALLRAAEWFFTVVFSVEYVLRIYAANDRRRYVFSFFGLVDLVALLPTYVSLALPGAQSLLVVRVLRLLRVFRILKLARFGGEAEALLTAIRSGLPKITVFIFTVLSIVVIVGSLMYLVEGPANGFTSIPQSMYWAIVTLTTVGFGDITPKTPAGQFLASLLMTLGYGVIAVPTGIISAELTRVGRPEAHDASSPAAPPPSDRLCRSCQAGAHAADALHCRLCGTRL